jgi:WD40 repeat protein/transcriptional regulator with XRE-family HTH domain
MSNEESFGQRVKDRRRELGLTQDELARRVGCAPVTLRKIEYDDLRPSVQIAERLAMALNIPLEERAAFVRLARVERIPEPPTPTPAPALEEIGVEDLTGRAIRGYALGERIGAGGMGAVYRAVQPLVEREVAVKIILPQYANHPEFIRRFEAEAQLVARLEHPHIVPLYDYWREPSVAFLVMRLLRGGSLRHLLESGPLPLEMALRMVEQVGAALGAAHRVGVIHRDLKPANILLDEDQNAYLADFGIAKNLGNPNLEDQTQVDAIVGSPAYISPEQIRSEFVRPQTDIYCLGVVLYELLTGHVPFSGPTPIEVMHQHLSAPLPPLAARRTGLPGTLDAVIERATAKDPLERYPGTDSLLADLRRAIHGEAPTVKIVAPAIELLPLTAADNPYKGLRAFGEADAHDFFGREALVQQLLVRMGEGGDLSRFLAVVGPSGSGKSSVVGAGLVPALRRGALPGSENWYLVELMPGAHPFEELEAALLRIAVNPPESLLSQLREDRRGLLRAVRRCLPDDPNVELVLVIDQFEEVFTLVQDEAVRAHLLDSLVTAALDERSRVRIVVTLRADFTDRPLNYVDFGELMRQRSEFVLPLTPDELERAIVGPAERVGLQLETGLAAAIMHDVGDQPGALPLLQYALTELFEKREGRTLTKKAYTEIGGVLGALGRRAEEVFATLDESAQVAARQLFLRLVTLGEGVEDTRRRVLKAEVMAIAAPTLTPSPSPFQGEGSSASPSPRRGDASPEAKRSGEGWGEGRMSEVIEAFGRSRLVSFDRDPLTRGPTVEVAHEALLREWPRLREWLNESRADVRLQRQLAQAAHEWQGANQDASFLLTGTRLAQFEGWAASTPIALTQDERAFLDASLAEREKRRTAEAERQAREAKLKQRVQRVLQVLAVVFLLAAIVSGGLAFWANGQRQRAETAEHDAQVQAAILLGAQAESEAEDGFYDRAVLLALEALERYPYTPQAEHALGQAVSNNRALQQYTDHTSAVTSLAWSPDGSKIASSSTDNTVRIWDPATGETIRVIELPKGITGNVFDWALTVRWTRDGQHLITLSGDRYKLGSQDYDLILWDSATGEQVKAIEIPNQAEPEEGEGTVTGFTNYPTGAALDVAPESGRLATVGGDNSAIVWDAALQTQELTLTGHENDVNGIDWSPDETRLATASEDGTARLWDAKTGEQVNVLTGHNGAVNTVLWSPDGAQLATGGDDGLVRIWDAVTSEAVQTIEPKGGIVWSLAWSPDGKYLVIGPNDKRLRVWDITANEPIVELSGHNDFIAHIAWSPNADRFASGGNDGIARVWEVTPEALVMLPYRFVAALDWSSDSRFLALPQGDAFTLLEPGALAIWDVTTGQLVELDTEFDYYGTEADYSPDDRLLFVRGLSSWPEGFLNANPAVVVHATTGETVMEINASDGNYIRDGDWSPDGARIATASITGRIDIWDFQTGNLLLSMNHGKNVFVNQLEWSPDGTKLATAPSDGIDTATRIWDVETGTVLMALVGHEPPTFINGAAWSPDGARILTVSGNPDFGASDNTARIWDASTGEILLVIDRHTGPVVSAEWSPDGARIATISDDETMRIWDATSGAELLNLSTPANYYLDMKWSPDGRYIAVGLDGFPARVFRVWQSAEELIAYAKECCIFRELTPEERQRFGLPPAPAAESTPSGARVGGVTPLVFALLAALPGAALVVRQNRRRTR